MRRKSSLACAMAAGLALMALDAGAGAPPAAPLVPKAGAPFDMTGYWVSVVTEDWVYRMLTPAKNDITSGVPVNAEARRVAGEWDIEKDKAAGEACRPFGAGGVMRQPGRLHITWADDQTLKMDLEAGTQTRMFNFKSGAASGASWQGYSQATWQKQRQARGMGGGGGAPPFLGPTQPGQGGTLEVVTTNLRPGYLLKNGVPYSANMKMTEYFDVVTLGDAPWLIVTTIIEDPQYLAQPYLLSTHFKKEKEPVQWSPRPCDTLPPLTDKPPLPRRN